MKPHEETLEAMLGPCGHRLWNGKEIVADESGDDYVAILSAAPEMARRLLAHGQFVTTSEGREWHTDDCMEFGHGAGCETDRAVLTKAGVLTP